MASAGLHRDPRSKPRWLQARNLLSEISLRLLVQDLLPFVAGRPINVGKRTQYRPPALKSYLPFALSAAQAYNVIEALKAMLGRTNGKRYGDLHAVQTDMEVRHGEDRETHASQVG